jgi:hypothetical protein
MEQQEGSTPTPREDSIFTEDDFSIEPYQKHIRKARNALFIIAGFYLLYAVYEVFKLDMTDLVSQVIVGVYVLFVGLYVSLALWTKKKPFTALVIALTLYLSLLVVSVIRVPESIISGIIWKIMIVVVLVRGLQNGREAQHMMETFGKRS